MALNIRFTTSTSPGSTNLPLLMPAAVSPIKHGVFGMTRTTRGRSPSHCGRQIDSVHVGNESHWCFCNTKPVKLTSSIWAHEMPAAIDTTSLLETKTSLISARTVAMKCGCAAQSFINTSRYERHAHRPVTRSRRTPTFTASTTTSAKAATARLSLQTLMPRRSLAASGSLVHTEDSICSAVQMPFARKPLIIADAILPDPMNPIVRLLDVCMTRCRTAVFSGGEGNATRLLMHTVPFELSDFLPGFFVPSLQPSDGYE